MVGVCDLRAAPSRPSSVRTSSIMPSRFFMKRMKGLPSSSMMSSEVTMLAAARNEMYWNTPAPGKSNALSSQSKR